MVETADDLACFFDTTEFAVAGTYTPSGGSPVPVDVVLTRDVEIAPSGYDTIMSDRVTVAAFSKSVVASPAKDATLVVGSETWTVQRVIFDDGSIVQAALR